VDGCQLAPGPHGRVVLVWALQLIRHIKQCQFSVLISEGVVVGGSTIISRIPNDCAVVAAAAACHFV
jgi:hypothetical protein